MAILDGVGWRSYPSWEVFGQDAPLGPRLAAPVSRDDHRLGLPAAPVTVVFYGDYTSVASRDTYAELKQVESLAGHRLAVVYRHFVNESDERAVRFAEAAEAAGAQGRFWAAHDRFYRHLRTSLDDIAIAGAQIGLDLKRLHDDLAHRRFLPVVLAHRNGGHDSDVVRAPKLFVNDLAAPAGAEVRELWTLVRDELRRVDEINRRPKGSREGSRAKQQSTGENTAWVGRLGPRQHAHSAIADSA